MPRRLMRITGNALISALLIMALVSIAVTAITLRLQMDLQRTQWLQDDVRLQDALDYSYFWARSVLIQHKSDASLQQHVEKIPETLASHTRLGCRIDAQINDLQARFNLNGLLMQGRSKEDVKDHFAAVIQFNFLLKTVLQLDAAASMTLSSRIANALDTHPNSHSLVPKHGNRTRVLADISELQALRLLSDPQWQRLAPYLTALPTNTPVNLNTASEPILRAILPQVDDNTLRQFVALRKARGGFRTHSLLQAALAELHINAKFLQNTTLESDYFELTAQGELGALSRALTVVLQRQTPKGKPIRVKVLHWTLSSTP